MPHFSHYSSGQEDHGQYPGILPPADQEEDDPQVSRNQLKNTSFCLKAAKQQWFSQQGGHSDLPGLLQPKQEMPHIECTPTPANWQYEKEKFQLQHRPTGHKKDCSGLLF